MPHVIIEYSANLRRQVAETALLHELGTSVLAQRDAAGGTVFPQLGLRVRAQAFDDYEIADSAAEYGFVHVTIKIGAGRSAAIERATVEDALSLLKRWSEGSDVPVALSVNLERMERGQSARHNGVRDRNSA